MSWQTLLLVSVVLSSIPVLLQRVLLKDDQIEPISFAIIFQFGVTIISTILTLLIRGHVSVPSFSDLGWSVLVMTLFYSLANIFIFHSLKTTEASRFTVIFASKTVFAVIALTIFFDEGLSTLQWLGTGLILLGVAIVYLQNSLSRVNRGDLLALGAAISFGIANTNDRYLIQFFDPYTYVIIGFLLPGMLLSLIYPRKFLQLKNYFIAPFMFKILILCTIYGIAAITFFAALQSAPNSSIVFTFNTFGAILTVVFSILFLGERDYLAKKILGATVSLIGLILVNK